MAHPDTSHISFTYLPVASMWVVTLHYLLCIQTHPFPPSYWLWLFSSQTFSRTCHNISQTQSFYTYLPLKMEQTSAYKIQTLGNYPEENIQLPQFYCIYCNGLKMTTYQSKHAAVKLI
jgi:hypothetical protein